MQAWGNTELILYRIISAGSIILWAFAKDFRIIFKIRISLFYSAHMTLLLRDPLFSIYQLQGS